MEQTQRALREDEPIMKAWALYKSSADYANTLKWAGQSNEGQLWAAFMAGWKAAGGVIE